MHQPLPPHLMQPTPTGGPSDVATQYAAPGNNSFSTNPANSHIFSSPSAPKAPYGSGDTDDGYTLVFPNLAAFNEWREKEEITQMVEFVKVRRLDTSSLQSLIGLAGRHSWKQG